MNNRINRIKKYSIFLIIIIALAIFIFITYDGNIPVQWKGNQVSSYMNKVFILFFPVIAILLLMYLEDLAKKFINKTGIDTNTFDFFNILSQIIIIGIEIQILLNLIRIRVNIIIIIIICVAVSYAIKKFV